MATLNNTPTPLTPDALSALGSGHAQINVSVDTALGLIHLLHTTAGINSTGWVLANSIEAAVRRIGLVNARLSNIVSPGDLDEADPAIWLELEDILGAKQPAASASHV